MRNPFQSIIGPPEGQPGGQGKHDDRNTYAEAVAEGMTDENAPHSISPGLLPGEEPATPIETGLGWDWMATAQATPRLPRRQPLVGGQYDSENALTILNSNFFVGKSKQETGIFRLNDDGSATFIPPEQFKLEVQNIFIKTVSKTSSGSSTKLIPAEKFWKEHRYRREREIVFKPGGTTKPNEHNLWRGFGVKPCKGWQKQRRLHRHILKIICRGDKAKFKYLIRWLAWAVQNPDEQAGVVIVLKSRKEGTGKSTLGVVMLTIFGKHGELIDDGNRLLKDFNDWIETKSFILAEEILWAGDPKTRDKLKSRITADTFQIERKFGAVRQISNRLHIIMTTNHDHAVGLGVGDRRFVVYDVSDERARDESWFGPIYRDLDEGGASEFLHFLKNVKLGGWHPRQILKTPETIEQQRMSGDSVSQWARACIEADAIIGSPRGPYGNDATHDLGQRIAVEVLRQAYTGYCKQQGLHAANQEGFGVACADMFGPRKRLKAKPSPTGSGKTHRPWGYVVPNGKKWQERVDVRLGIKS